MTPESFDPQAYWEARLASNPTLQGTGHRAFSLDYNQWLYRAQYDCLDGVLRRNNVPLQSKRVLDVGSGTGFYVDYFLQQGASVVGLDIAPASVAYLEQHYPAGNFYVSDISASEQPMTGSFDLAALISVLYHIVDDARFEQALRNVAQCLNPGGYLVLTDTLQRGLIPTAGHTRFRLLADYQRVLQSHGVQILHVAPIYFFLNRSFIPMLGPRLISALGLGKAFYQWDQSLRARSWSNGAGMKLVLAKKQG
jgi:SAM-dependent methyltransferase